VIAVGVDAQAWRLSSTTWMALRLSARNLVEHCLAGHAEFACGGVQREVAVGTSGLNVARISSVSWMRQDACGAICAAGRRPSETHGRIVWVKAGER
jgi:hypothetical protein